MLPDQIRFSAYDRPSPRAGFASQHVSENWDHYDKKNGVTWPIRPQEYINRKEIVPWFLEMPREIMSEVIKYCRLRQSREQRLELDVESDLRHLQALCEAHDHDAVFGHTPRNV